jgi:protein-tyrosine phosphatase
LFETPIHWVMDIEPHRLGLMARPRGAEDLRNEVEAWRLAGIGSVVSLLEASEIRELELREESVLCTEYGIEYRSFPIPDRGAPASLRELSALIDELHARLLAGKAVAIHCRAGIGRTGLVAGCLALRLGVASNKVFNLLSRSRGVPMPDTKAQLEWFEKYALASTTRT